MNIKLKKIFERYKRLITKKAGGHKAIRKGNITKRRILRFYEKNKRWPNRTSTCEIESLLGSRFENFVSPTAPAYDYRLRRIALVSGRKASGKRKHNIQEFKKEIISFVEIYGRVPARYKNQKIEGEGRLRAKLEYYTKECGDMTFLSKIYSADKCHRSGIPLKYRPLINRNLDELEKPLVRLTKTEIKGE